MSRLWRLFRRPKPLRVEDTLPARESTMGAHLDVVRRGHVIVRTGDEWVAYRAGRRGRWDQWRAIQMLGGLDSPRVGTRPTIKSCAPEPHPDTVGCPDYVPESWSA